MAEKAPTTLVLVRHGESEGNRDQHFGGHGPTALTERGRQQADRVAARLAAEFPAEALVSSDLVRAVQTAEPIAAATRLAMATERGLRERSVGVFDGMRFADAQAQYPEIWAKLAARDPDTVPPGGEHIDDVYARVSATIDALVDRHRGQRVICVSHGIAIFHAFSYITGLGSPAQQRRVFTLVDNASISVFETRGDHWRIKCLNDTAHLTEVGVSAYRGI